MTVPRNEEQPLSSEHSLDQMLRAAGEMGSLIRQMDWAKTALGPIESWPQSLKTAVSICLFSEFPIHIWWGPEFVELYNDAYRPILGETKHPGSLGQPGVVTSAEIWPIIGPMLQHVYDHAVSTRSDNLMLPMERYGFIEETYFTLSYSPIFVETGGVGGIFTVVSETSRQVIGERRLKTLYHLSEHISAARNIGESCQQAAEILATNREDIPFALIYLINEAGDEARLMGSAGFDSESELNPISIDLNDKTMAPWRLREVLASGQSIRIDNLSEHFQTALPSPWEEEPRTALVLPIFSAGESKLMGFLLGGISARLALDEAYQHFYELLAAHIATAIGNALTYEAEHKRAEALTALDRAKTEFFSNISHEFRTPLTLILNPLQDLLSRPDKLDDGQRETLELAHRNSRRLLKLVNTLLEFSRIQANRMRASFVPSDLAAVTVDIASNFRSVIERAGLRLHIDCPVLPEAVYIDQEMWEKILSNLLSNAFKFTFEGEITVSLRPAGERIELKIQDTGVGIAAADLSHIFERFHRVDAARSRSYEGSGIGLALVEELVQLHGGDIRVSSQPDIGTTFTISIPFGSAHLPQDQIASSPLPRSNPLMVTAYTEEAQTWLSENVSKFDSSTIPQLALPQRSDTKIVIADDNVDMRDYLRRLLEPHFQVESASDGLSAMKLILQEAPTLVLADMMMPVMDGLSLVREMRSDARTRSMPLILLSARAGEEARLEALEAGADDYLTKPFSPRELLVRIEAQLKLAQMRRESQAAIDNIVESIADPFFVLDHSWQFIYANQAAQQLLGKTREELIGKYLSEVFLQGIGNRVYEIMQSAVISQHPVAVEVFDASLARWVDINVYPGTKGIAFYFRNINERKQAEEAARLAQTQLDAERQQIITIFESISDAFIALDRDYRFTYLNQHASELFSQLTGETVSDFMGQQLWELFPTFYSSSFGELLRRAMSTGIPGQVQALLEPINLWLDARVYPSAEGLSIYMADFTETQKTQQALREAQEHIGLLIDSVKDYAIFSLNTEGHIQSWNTGAERMFGYSEAEAIGQRADILYTPEDRAAGTLDIKLKTAIEQGYAENERWYQHKDAHRFYASGMVRPIYDESGGLKGFAKVDRDTTERKMAEERNLLLQELTAALSASLTMEQVVGAVIQKGLQAFGADSSGIFQLSEDGQTLKHLGNNAEITELNAAYERISIHEALPIANAIKDEKLLWLESQEDLIQNYPILRPELGTAAYQALICLPFRVEHRITGGMYLLFSHAKPYNAQEKTLLSTIALLCAQALERARLYEIEAQARQNAEEALSKNKQVN